MISINRFMSGIGRQTVRWLLFATVALGLGGCGGSESANQSNGEVVVGLTDAEGDFLSYTVDVLSISLIRADGTAVEALPTTTRVDFAQYTEVSEFVTAASVPSGTYVKARLRLDYSAAEIKVEKSGSAVGATARDTLGNTLTTLDLNVNFDGNRALVIAPGTPAHLTLDFNLAASNQVDTTPTVPVVTVEPFLVADINPVAPKTHRVRGPLRSVDTANASFRIGIRPFLQSTGEHGALNVSTNATTVFEIDGVSYNHADGIAALAAKPLATAVAAVGDLQVGLHRFLAREVYAGSSVPYGTSDVVTGSVISRTGNSLLVRGATLVRANGTFSFRDNVAVQIGDATKILKQATATDAPTKSDISVGSHVTIFGNVTADGETPQLDATGGLVRLLVTSVRGTVNTVAGGTLEMTLRALNGRPVNYFSFAGTGATSAQDADPLHYEVALGLISGTGLTTGTSVRVKGFVRPFGNAPVDFTALSVANLKNEHADLLFAWNPPTATPFSASEAAGLTLNTQGAGLIHHVWRDGMAIDLLALGNAPVIAPANPTQGLFAIGHAGSVQIYTGFDTYRLALAERLGGGLKARGIGARGTFDETSAQLNAVSAFVNLQ